MAPLHLLRHRAVITGASRGIGLSIARLFAQEGASCLLVARSEPALKAAVAGLEGLKLPVSVPEPEEGEGGDGGQRFQYVVGSVAEESTWKEVVRREVSFLLFFLSFLFACLLACLWCMVGGRGFWSLAIYHTTSIYLPIPVYPGLVL